jgi:hypothetical protein
MRAVIPAALLLCACSTPLTIERYPIGSPEKLRAASITAAQQLGWEIRYLEPNAIHLAQPSYPFFTSRPDLDILPEADGTLTIRGQSADSGKKDDDGRQISARSLGPYSVMLAQATQQVLGKPPEGAQLQRRSGALVFLTDLVLPELGAIFAQFDSPFAYGPAPVHVAIRLAMDAAAAASIAQMYSGPNAFGGFPDRGVAATLAISYIILNRLAALFVDIPLVGEHNTAADAGLWLDANHPPPQSR